MVSTKADHKIVAIPKEGYAYREPTQSPSYLQKRPSHRHRRNGSFSSIAREARASGTTPIKRQSSFDRRQDLEESPARVKQYREDSKKTQLNMVQNEQTVIYGSGSAVEPKEQVKKSWPPMPPKNLSSHYRADFRDDDTRSRTSGISSKYLAALKGHQGIVNRPNLSVVEIPAEGIVDVGELSITGDASVMTEEDHMMSPKRTMPSSRFDVPRVRPTTDSEIEKTIETRVNAEVSKMEKYFKSEIKRIELFIDQEYQARFEALEDKTDKMNSMISQLVSGKTVGRLEI